ncbi:MAG: hypothetical protein GWP05_00930 [Anaerolineaceae bacterium]|nr:hypothetical protein [Anaerolineaceae bacterium]
MKRAVCCLGGALLIVLGGSFGRTVVLEGSVGIQEEAEPVARMAVGPHSQYSCADCHVARKKASDGDYESFGNSPLWNTRNIEDGQTVFVLYSSPTFDALRTDIGQPDGASKLCLGCHDGSVSFRGRRGLIFGADSLARSHPISFTYDSALAMRVRRQGLRDPKITQSGLGSTIARDLLDAESKMQCTSCHEVHGWGQTRSLLRYPYNSKNDGPNTFCRVCHNK